MNESRVVETFNIQIPREQAYRLLGMHRKEREPMESVLRNFDREFAAAHELVEARAVSVTRRTGIRGSTFFDDSAPIALVVCTIGSALEERVAELSARDRVARAMLLDAVGSAAVEELADRCNRRICEQALAEELDPGPRVSPGYGTWKLDDQAWLFAALEPEEIGVILSETWMMTPRKSISYAVPLTGGMQRARGRCTRCGLADCAHRAG